MALNFSEDEVLEHVDLNNMLMAANGDGVIDDPDNTSLAVTARGAMGVRVGIGKCKITGIIESESTTTNLTIEAASVTEYRKDLITYDASANNPAVVKGDNHAGTTADPTYPPDLPAGDILLAIVSVDASETVIVTADIKDSRIFVEKGWTYSGASVFTGNAPTSWTDLALGSVVGSNRAVAVLKLKNTDTSSDAVFSFRPNNDGDDYSYGAPDANPSSFKVYHDHATLVTVQTDATGRIEWECTSSGVASTIHVLSYVKLTS